VLLLRLPTAKFSKGNIFDPPYKIFGSELI
jgi:hypothetical protein